MTNDTGLFIVGEQVAYLATPNVAGDDSPLQWTVLGYKNGLVLIEGTDTKGNPTQRFAPQYMLVPMEF